jgi:hypothetical protein
MRVMTVRAFHESLVDAMFKRHGELRANVGVTAVTELWLGLCQKELWCCRFMNRMAARTRNVIQSVCAIEARSVAPKTGGYRLLGRQLGEGNDRSFASVRFDVIAPRPMATFATRIDGLFLTAGNTFEVRILIEVQPDVGMTRLANGASDVCILCCLTIVRCAYRTANHQQQTQGDKFSDS